MGNLSVNLTLTSLQTAMIRTGKNGHNILYIDLDAEPGVTVKDDRAYYNATAFERKEVGQHGETHFIKPYVPGATKEEKDSHPIIGNVRPIKRAATTAEAPDDDDIPF